MKIKKNIINKKVNQGDSSADTRDALGMIRLHNNLKKNKDVKDKSDQNKKQNKALDNNFCKTAKEISNGSFAKTDNMPTFSQEQAEKFYSDRYEKPVKINKDHVKWFPKANLPKVQTGLKPYTPKDI